MDGHHAQNWGGDMQYDAAYSTMFNSVITLLMCQIV